MNDSTVIILSLVISLAITLVLYCLVPLIYAATVKNPITKKKYRITCYGINLVIAIIIQVLNYESSGGGSSAINFAPYLLWTSVFAAVGLKKLSKREMLIDEG